MANVRFRENPGLQRWPRTEQDWKSWVNEAGKWISEVEDLVAAQAAIITAQAAADAAQTDADTAQTDLEANNVTVESLSQLKWSDAAGVWPADDSDDHVLTFRRQGTSIATHTIRAVFTQSSGNWTVTSFVETGEATVETITGSGGKDAKAVVSHTASGVIGKVTLQSVNQSAVGASPSK